jgi:hypothetical protein
MRNANSALLILLGCAVLSGCGGNPSDQNVAMANNAAVPADIEALPADESSATPSNELAGGTGEEAVNEPANSANSY